MRYFNSLLYNKTVSPLMLWSQIIYRHRTASIAQKKSSCRRPGAVESYDFLVNFLDIIRCPVKLSYYIKFHGARTTFCWVIEGTITSAGHRLHTSDGHRTIFWKFNSYDFNGGRASYDVWKEQGTFENLFTSFMSRTATGEKRRVFAEVHIESV